MYSTQTKKLAKKAANGDKEAMSLLIIQLPSGVPTDDESLKSKAREVAGEAQEAEEPHEEPHEEPEEDAEYKDMELKDSILAALSGVDMSTEQMEAVCKAIYGGIEGGEISPSNPGFKDKKVY